MPAYGIWQIFTASSIVAWSLLAVEWAGYWFLVTGAPVWHVPGVRFRWICPSVFGVAAMISAVGLLEAPAGWSYLHNSLYAVLWDGGEFTLYVVLGLLFRGGREPPTEPVDLSFPFERGRYYVVQGGATKFVNRHVTLLDQPDHEARGESHGVDIVELNDWGARASGLLPRRPDGYEIFGRTLLAPLAGEVVHAEADHPDHPPPEHDAENAPGNCVWIQNGDTLVLLAHLKQGSLAVEPGDRVEAGEPVAEIGNSGRTTEPHLHIHVQRPPDEGPRHSGDPLPLAFDGDFPVQSDVYDA